MATLAAPYSTRQGFAFDHYVLVAMIALSWLAPSALFTAALAGAYLLYAIYAPKGSNGAAIKLAAPFLLMAGYAALLSGNNEGYEALKDLWYSAKLVMCLMLGFLVAARDPDGRRIAKVLIYFAVFAAVLSVAAWVYYTVYANVELDEDSETLRIPVVALAALPLMLDRLWKGRGNNAISSLLMLGVMAIAIALSNSRITLLVTLVMILAWLGLFSSWKRALPGILLIAVIGSLLWRVLPEFDPSNLSMMSKFRHSLEEIFLTDDYNQQNVLLNWRGFEAYNAQLMFDRSDLLSKIFGNGLGATVDLGNAYHMGKDMVYQFLPTLHNGFYHILIKFGIVGIFIYAVAVFNFANWMGGGIPANRIDERMRRGIVIAIFMATMVITGLYNKTALDGILLLVGWLCGSRHREKLTNMLATLSAPRQVQPI